MENTSTQIAAGALVGLVYGLYGFLTKHERGEKINPKKLARTIVLFGVGGAISAGVHGDITEAGIEAQATALAGTIGLAFDMAWGYLVREGVVPGEPAEPVAVAE